MAFVSYSKMRHKSKIKGSIPGNGADPLSLVLKRLYVARLFASVANTIEKFRG